MSTSGPLILIPPSEGKASGGDGAPWTPGSTSWQHLDDRRLTVAKALRSAMRRPVATRTKLLGVKGSALAEATATNLAVLEAPTMAAIDRYTGVLYDELDAASLPTPVRGRFDRQVVVFSGLWGPIRPRDQIPDYKLKMGASLGRPGKLSTWWRGALSDAIAGDVAGTTVWDLLPHEHRAAWAPRSVADSDPPRQIVSARFLDEQRPARRGRTGELVAVAHWNKLLKGSLVRHLVTTQLTEIDDLADFDHPRGYLFRPSLTATEGERTVVSFVRPHDADDLDADAGKLGR